MLQNYSQSLREKKKLTYEHNIYCSLEPQSGIPKFHWFGTENGFYVLIIDLLGPSLSDLFHYCDDIFSLKTVLMIADQLLGLLEYLHSQNFIHRDIKPGNFCVGVNEDEKNIYIIDFGLAKRYRDEDSNEHIPYSKKKRFVGTARYESLRAHQGIEQSRRDDLESLGFILVHFLKGKLPWQGMKAKSRKELHEKIRNKKNSVQIKVLCEGLPPEFEAYFTYCRQLGFDENPNYEYLRLIFRNLFIENDYIRNFEYDWDLKDITTKQTRPKIFQLLPLGFSMGHSSHVTKESLATTMKKKLLKQQEEKSIDDEKTKKDGYTIDEKQMQQECNMLMNGSREEILNVEDQNRLHYKNKIEKTSNRKSTSILGFCGASSNFKSKNTPKQIRSACFTKIIDFLDNR